MSDTANTTVTVRPATAKDTAFLVSGNMAMALETEGRRLDVQRLTFGVRAALADASRGSYYIAEVGGRPAGQALVTREWSDWRNGWFWWLQSVHVIPEHRRRGVFRAIYGYIADAARSAGDVCGLRLYVEQENTAALATYQALGMDVSGYRLCEHDWSAGS
ncbi:MAG TPA: GNAT family N-acetyltransferase [Phycisphaerae bacterium]|nr:GNAT family N-acetyltransferase [Phycisphaerales bacterium]HRX84205.1 GNAT family N-acetyltransferase [Phycisphaerae bacterium]